jgi:hypothetical protein
VPQQFRRAQWSVRTVPGTAREALIAEAIGDVARLLDRAKALQPLMLESSRALVDDRAGPATARHAAAVPGAEGGRPWEQWLTHAATAAVASAATCALAAYLWPR